MDSYSLSRVVPRPAPLMASVALIALGIALYWQTLSCPFITLDDPDYVTENAMVQQGLTATGFVWAFTSTHAGNWHPFTWISHMVDCQFWGLDPRGHHFTNILLHICTAVLLFNVFRIMTGALWRSVFVAALFLVHPLHVESVAWVAERKDVLSGLFFVLGLYAYARYAECSSRTRYLILLLCFAAGLLSKPMLVTFPFVLLLLDFWPLGRWRGLGGPSNRADLRVFTRPGIRALLLEKVPLILMSVLSCVVTIFAQQRGGAISSLDAVSFSARFANAIAACMVYLEKSFWPHDMAIFYPYAEAGARVVALGTLVLVAASSAAVFLARRIPALPTGWFWFLGMLVPVIGMVQVGGQSMADRYLYLPLIGLSVAVVWTAAYFTGRLGIPRLLPILGGGVVIAALSVVTVKQLSLWHNGRDLFAHALSVTVGNYVAHSSLGAAYLAENNLDAASEHFSRAARLRADYLPALFGLAKVMETRGRLDDAEGMLRVAVSAKPDSAPVHYNLGAVLTAKGNTIEARTHYIRALALDPADGRAHNNLSSLLLAEGDVDGAMKHARTAVRLLPRSAEARFNLGNVFFLIKEFKEAAMQYRLALAVNPAFAEARLNLAKVLVAARLWDQAELELEALIRGNPADYQAHQLLVSVLVGRNFSQKAVDELRRMLRVVGERSELLNNLAWLLATDRDAKVRNGAEAVKLAERACGLTSGTNISMLNTLAAAHAETRNFEKAVAFEIKAREMADVRGDDEAVRVADGRLELYRSGVAFRTER